MNREPSNKMLIIQKILIILSVILLALVVIGAFFPSDKVSAADIETASLSSADTVSSDNVDSLADPSSLDSGNIKLNAISPGGPVKSVKENGVIYDGSLPSGVKASSYDEFKTTIESSGNSFISPYYIDVVFPYTTRTFYFNRVYFSESIENFDITLPLIPVNESTVTPLGSTWSTVTAQCNYNGNPSNYSYPSSWSTNNIYLGSNAKDYIYILDYTVPWTYDGVKHTPDGYDSSSLPDDSSGPVVAYFDDSRIFIALVVIICLNFMIYLRILRR